MPACLALCRCPGRHCSALCSYNRTAPTVHCGLTAFFPALGHQRHSPSVAFTVALPSEVSLAQEAFSLDWDGLGARSLTSQNAGGVMQQQQQPQQQSAPREREASEQFPFALVPTTIPAAPPTVAADQRSLGERTRPAVCPCVCVCVYRDEKFNLHL